ncbi:MAG TPA: signal peptidase II [Bryobacteraceae bacterium]|nr:signal peptidase II [Bryobacteraceae bacterium]HPQ17054.1 signal peptidase II [Bryobacteraceae bacterium]
MTRLRALSYGLAALVFLIDRITKMIVQRTMSVWDSFTVIPGFFDIIHTENPGAAFSMFASAQPEVRTFVLVGLSAAAVVLIGVLLWQAGGRMEESRIFRWGLALIMGGALGNLYDRVLNGKVTDFLDLYVNGYHWPAFNVADSAITIGAALVLLDMLQSSRRPALKT